MSDGDSGRRVIDGRFALEARLGGGGMGTVWRAQDLALDRAVALKEVRPPDPGLAEYDPEAAQALRARVLREARALARVDHPNVVTIHHIVDSGEGSYPWLVMELVTGGSLQDRLDRGPMEPTEAARFGREVLAALRAAHERGIQHRDVKPANVLLRPDGRPVLTDFGIAAIRESTALTATGSIIGTPDYMAPERITGDDGGPGADLWSLGMMLYVAVEGRHPLRRATTLATLAAVLNEELPPPRQAGPMTGVLHALLAKDPSMRPGPDALDRMLAAAADGTPDPGSPAPGITPPAGSAASGTSPAPATSYPLTPPQGAHDPHRTTYPTPPATYGHGPTPPAAYGPAPAPSAPPGGGYGYPAPQSGYGYPPPQDAAPYGAFPRTVVPASPGAARRTRMSRRVTIGSSLIGTALVGVTVWALLPGPDDRDPASAAPGISATGTPAQGNSRAPEVSSSTPAPSGESTGGASAKSLLTPDGIRLAIKELKATMGTDQVGSFTAYPDFVSVEGMVKGSKTHYDSYTYRIGQGVTRGLSSGSLVGGEEPVSMDAFDWDALPALMRRAEKDLNVKKPTSRYLVIRQPNNIFHEPAGMAVYLGDQYDSGYIDATPKGKVTRVMPADS